jgi:hypothetical protein
LDGAYLVETSVPPHLSAEQTFLLPDFSRTPKLKVVVIGILYLEFAFGKRSSRLERNVGIPGRSTGTSLTLSSAQCREVEVDDD